VGDLVDQALGVSEEAAAPFDEVSPADVRATWRRSRVNNRTPRRFSRVLIWAERVCCAMASLLAARPKWSSSARVTA
jgi:hypothetical protein